MSDQKNPDGYRLKFSPELEAELDDETKGQILSEMAEVMLPGGVEALMAKSRRVDVYPEDGLCPFCGCGLVIDRDWDDEWECPNQECEGYRKVAYITTEMAETIISRMPEDFNAETD